jgi:carboxylesterase type B
VYSYEFAHLYASDQSVLSGIVRFPPTNGTTGWASHFAEVAFVFGSPFLPSFAPFTPAEMALSQEMMTRWANFAKTGVPAAPQGSKLPEWPKVTTTSGSSLRFQTGGSVVQHVGSKEEQCDALRGRVEGPSGDCLN